jgi:hypothetical protein
MVLSFCCVWIGGVWLLDTVCCFLHKARCNLDCRVARRVIESGWVEFVSAFTEAVRSCLDVHR